MKNLKILLDSLVKLSNLNGTPGDVSFTLAYNTEFIKRKISFELNKREKYLRDSESFSALLEAHVRLVEINCNNPKPSHVIHSSIEFIRRRISIEIKRKERA